MDMGVETGHEQRRKRPGVQNVGKGYISIRDTYSIHQASWLHVSCNLEKAGVVSKNDWINNLLGVTIKWKKQKNGGIDGNTLSTSLARAKRRNTAAAASPF